MEAIKKISLWDKIKKNKAAYLMILPILIGAIGFSYYPAISGIVTSFFKWNGTGNMEFVGINNYVTLFTNITYKELFLPSIGNMFLLLIPRLIIGVIMPLIMAELIFNIKNKKAQAFYRFAVLIPMVAPGVVTLLIWKDLFNANGLFSNIFTGLGLIPEGFDFFSKEGWVYFAVIFMGFPWTNGTSILIYLSGMNGISEDVIEASRLDKCSTWKRIFKIDIPLLMGQVRYFIIFGAIGLLQDFGIQMVITDYGPSNQTNVPAWFMYKMFQNQEYGMACAIGTLLFIVIFAASIITFKALKYGPFAPEND